MSPLLPLAIAQLEAKADFSSNRAITLHNIFGMKYPAGRAGVGLSTAVGQTADGFAIFRSIYGSIDDFMYRLEVFGVFTDAQLDQHIKDKKYNTEPGYYQKVMAIASQLAPTMIDTTTLVAATAAGGVGLGVALSLIKKIVK